MTNLNTGRIQSVPMEIGDYELTEIGMIMEMRRNFSLSANKDKCMKRRVAIRMSSCGCNDAAAYCNLLRQNEHELDHLKKALTIHVSQFFRNPSMFEKLRSDVLPSLFANSSLQGRELRILSLGCAGGEEAYSIAILLREHFALQLKVTPALIDATDIDQETLQVARRGVYSEDRLKKLPNGLMDHYFSVKGSLLQLSQNILEMVTFNQGNIRHLTIICPKTWFFAVTP